MKKRIFKVIFITILLMVVYVGYYFLNRHFDIGIPCFIHETYGLVCPGCGVTRMFFALLNLDFKAAFFYNPLVFLLLPFMIGYYIYFMYLYIIGQKEKILSTIPWYVYFILVVIVIIYAVLRNLPMFPFLRP